MLYEQNLLYFDSLLPYYKLSYPYFCFRITIFCKTPMRKTTIQIGIWILLTHCTISLSAREKPERLKTTPFEAKDVRITNGPFKHAEEKEAEYLLRLEPDKLLSGFRTEAGLTPKATKYGGWESQGVAGQSLGHYLSACAIHYASTKDQRYLERVNYIVDEFEECQKANGNGYLAATPDGKRIFNEIAGGKVYSQGFDLNGGWVPLYVMHKVLAGLIDAYQHAGNAKALTIASALGDFMYRTFYGLNEENMQAVLACEYGGMNEALANLYALTHNSKYLDLARRFDNHKTIMDPLARQQDDLEGKHANTQVPKIVGSARLYELTGSQRDSTIATFFWNTVIKNHTYINGGNSDGEHFGTPGKLNDRLGTGTTETCNTYNMLKLTEHLFSWNPDPKYSDYYERAVYNHILASQNPDDGMCTYYTPLVSGGIKGYLSPFESFACCTGSGLENHVKYGSFIYSKGSDGSLFVNLFIPSELNWEEGGIRLEQKTDLPSSNTTTFLLSCKKSTKKVIRIRHPQWASSMEIRVNGKVVSENSTKDTYVCVERKWKDQDSIEVRFHIELYTVSMPDNPNRVGLFYGPALLAGELGKKEPDMVTGIPVLVTEGRPIQEWIEKISDHPLRFRTKGVGEPFQTELIPFYAMHHQHYIVYWDIFTRAQWDKEQAAYKAELLRLQELDKITVDYIALGEMQPERDHNLRGQSIGNGIFNKKKWRAAWTGGWFSFDMKVLPDKPMKLIVTYWGSETPEKEFTISIDEKILTTQKIHLNKPGEFFEISYPLPQEMTTGKEKITVKFDGKPTWTGAIYHARIVQ